MATPTTPPLRKRLGDLDHRRRSSRRRAPIWFTLSILVVSMAGALCVMIVLALLARAWSFLTDRSMADVPVWGWAGESIVVVVVVLVLAVFAALFGAGLLGVSKKVLEPLGELTEPAPGTQVSNLLAELSLGLGIDPPHLLVSDDPAPNALSLPHRTWGRTIVVTTGLSSLSRDEMEAVLAHEISHLYAPDARWAEAAQFGVDRARAAGMVMLSVSAFLALTTFWTLAFASVFLFTPLLGALAFAIVGGSVELAIGPVSAKLRADADQLADVGAVVLARHPEALARACDRLAADTERVKTSSRTLDCLWFKAVIGLDQSATTPDGTVLDANGLAGHELRRRADAAYATANIPRP